MRQPLERPPKVDYTGRWGKVQEWWDKQKRKWCVVAPTSPCTFPALSHPPPPSPYLSPYRSPYCMPVAPRHHALPLQYKPDAQHFPSSRLLV